MHYLFILEYWFVTNYLVGSTETKCVKFGGPHLQRRLEKHFLPSLSTHHMPPALYTCKVLPGDLS